MSLKKLVSLTHLVTLMTQKSYNYYKEMSVKSNINLSCSVFPEVEADNEKFFSALAIDNVMQVVLIRPPSNFNDAKIL